MTKPKPSRAIAAAALVVACLLLPAGFVSQLDNDTGDKSDIASLRNSFVETAEPARDG